MWADWGDRAIATAYELLEDIRRRQEGRGGEVPRYDGDEAPQMSG